MEANHRGRWACLGLLVLAAALLPAACGGGDSTTDADADVDAEAVDGEDVPVDGEDVPDGEPDAGDVGDVEDVPEGEGSACTTGADCNDHNTCTIDACRGGYCVHTAAPDGTACDDDWFCTLPGTCAAGECTGVEDNDCDDEDSCTSDSCDEIMAECRHELVPVPGAEGPPGDATCSDTADNDCDRLVDDADPNCVPCGTAADCDDGNTCTDDTCDAGVCHNTPVADGATCDDGQFCTTEDACSAGVCVGPAPRDCSTGVPSCNVGLCSEGADRCDVAPVPDGTACNDGRYCTVGETCAGGMCGGAAARDCSSLDDQCNVGVCDDAAGVCAAQPRADGTACDDGAFCTTGEVCTGGACGGGAARDCSSFGDACNVGTCDEAGAACYAEPRADGTVCSDGDACTSGDSCTGGACGGAAVDCSSLTDTCNTGVCDPASGCEAEPVTDGTACNDGVYCTTGEACTGGVCGGGAPRACGDGDACTSDSCSETLGRCDNVLVPVPGAEGPRGSASCADGIDNDCDRATDALDTDCETCTTAADCNDLDPCTTDACTGGSCRHAAAPDGTACNDGRYCTNPDVCTGGVCGGGARDCSASGNQCNTGRCDEGADRCYADPLPNGTTCNDGQYCTNPDSCTGGVCGGGARDCSAVANDCNSASCNESTDSCVPAPRANGTPCTDGLFCTNPDVCTGGACGGPARDCSSAGSACALGTCNESTDACVGTPQPDGTVCDADANPATRDICRTGSCVASACGDGFWDAGGGEACDDGNTVTETCFSTPTGACVRDCSIRQDTCGNGTLETAYGETCDPGIASPPCDTSCLPVHRGIGSACTCVSGCRAGDPTAGTWTGCEDVVAPTGSRPACYHSDVLAGNNVYFPGGYCGAYAHTCSPSWMCSLAGIPRTVGTYASFVGPCPTGSILVNYTVSSSGVTVQIRACFTVCDEDADCRWNQVDTYWNPDVCGHYECITSPSTPGTRICFDTRMAPP